MVNIPIRDIPGALGEPNGETLLAMDNGVMRKTTVQAVVEAGRPVASQAEAQAGTDNVKAMTALRVAQAITAQASSQFATAAQGALADTAVQPSRTITAGAGLTGGGNLVANRTIALDSASIASLALASSAVQPNRALIAGTGLFGGGDLSEDRTLSLSSATIASLASADSAVQPDGLAAVATSGAYGDLSGRPTLGNSASRDVGTVAGTVAAGDDTRVVNAVQTSRTISAGTGLTGGGSLAANRSIALSSTSIASLAKADSALQSVVAGTNVTVDNTDPRNPVITASLPSGAVSSVNGQSGNVVLTAADVGAAPTVHTHTLAQITNAGTAAAKNTGTSGDAVPLLNAANTWSGAQTIAVTAATPFVVNRTTGTVTQQFQNNNGSAYFGLTSGGSEVRLGTSGTLSTFYYATTTTAFTVPGSLNGASLSLTNPAPVASGGTGRNSLTAFIADLPTFTTTVRGTVPPPTTVTGKFLSDDQTWKAVPQGIGDGQSWQSPSRAAATVYQNTSGSSIEVVIRFTQPSSLGLSAPSVSVDGATYVDILDPGAAGEARSISFIVPNGHFYQLRRVSGSSNAAINSWRELRA